MPLPKKFGMERVIEKLLISLYGSTARVIQAKQIRTLMVREKGADFVKEVSVEIISS